MQTLGASLQVQISGSLIRCSTGLPREATLLLPVAGPGRLSHDKAEIPASLI
jgi:hypothetical protein